MDSVTQFTLGAAVGVAVMGRSQPAWKSAILGGICGTLPDLDAFIDHGDAISNMVGHRAQTHAIFWQMAAAPFIAAVFAIADRSVGQFFRWWLMTLLVLTTHTGLDALTVYGTQLLLPLSDQPYGLGSIFIIDPIYSLLLLLGLAIAVFGNDRWRWNIAGLVLSSGYLAWTVFAQQHVTSVVAQTPAVRGVPADRVLVTPTPFNSVLWRIVVMHPDRYEEGFYSLLDPIFEPRRALKFKAYDRGAALDKLTRAAKSADKIRRFSKGFYAVGTHSDGVTITDLRMGQNPWYVFSFEFMRREGRQFNEVAPRNIASRENLPIQRYLKWLWSRIMARDTEPPR